MINLFEDKVNNSDNKDKDRSTCRYLIQIKIEINVALNGDNDNYLDKDNDIDNYSESSQVKVNLSINIFKYRLICGGIPFTSDLHLVHSFNQNTDFIINDNNKNNSQLFFLLIKARNGVDWIFPKGGWENYENAESCALRETFEESGVKGCVVKNLGMANFPLKKKKKEKKKENENRSRIRFFLIKIKNIHYDHIEKNRSRKFFTLEECVGLLNRVESKHFFILALDYFLNKKYLVQSNQSLSIPNSYAHKNNNNERLDNECESESDGEYVNESSESYNNELELRPDLQETIRKIFSQNCFDRLLPVFFHNEAHNPNDKAKSQFGYSETETSERNNNMHLYDHAYLNEQPVIDYQNQFVDHEISNNLIKITTN